MTAAIRGIEGDHIGAIKLLEDIYPLARYARGTYPHLYFDYLNSFAIELAGIGRYKEALNICRVVLESPFARAYPEWQETEQEILLKMRAPQRSDLFFPHPAISFGNRFIDTAKIAFLENHRKTTDDNNCKQTEPGRLFNFRLKDQKMTNEKNKNDKDQKKESYKDVMREVLDLLVNGQISYEDLERIRQYLRDVADQEES